MKLKTIVQSFMNLKNTKNYININLSGIIKYMAYIIIFLISVNSVINTKDYITKNKNQELKKIVFHSLVSLIILWI